MLYHLCLIYKQIGLVKNFTRFIYHFHFFFCISIFQKPVYMRDAIKPHGLRKDRRVILKFLPAQDLIGLLFEQFHGRLPIGICWGRMVAARGASEGKPRLFKLSPAALFL